MELKPQVATWLSWEGLSSLQCNQRKLWWQMGNRTAGLQQVSLREEPYSVLHHQQWSLLRIIVIWILCRTLVLEQLVFTREAWGPGEFFNSRRETLGGLHDYWRNKGKLYSPLQPNEHVKQQWEIQLHLLQIAVDAQVVWHKEEKFQMESLKTLLFP